MDIRPSLESLDARIVPAVIRGRWVYPLAAERTAATAELRRPIETPPPEKQPVLPESQTDATSVILGGKMGPRRSPGSWINSDTRPVNVVYQPWYY